jgi:penicillin amidase
MVVEMPPGGPRGRLLLPTGQSGNPFSPHYRDMNEAWRTGDLAPLSVGTADTDTASTSRASPDTAELIILVPDAE